MKVALLLWDGPHADGVGWPLGPMVRVPYEARAAREQVLRLLDGDADYVLFWDPALGVPDPDRIEGLARPAEVVHAGLLVGTRGLPEELDYVHDEWSLLDPAEGTRATSWRVSLRCCLAPADVLRTLGAIDPAFAALDAAGLEAGLRWMRQGAVVWYDPRLAAGARAGGVPGPHLPLSDRYLFLLRTYKPIWSRYVRLRRSLATARPRAERAAAGAALAAAASTPPVGEGILELPEAPEREAMAALARVSVIVPTLGRYPYLPAALESLRRQTVRPFEVVCVDQNHPAERRPDVYRPFEDLNLRVIWQDQRGQSLARNTALAATRGDYIFLFDDDSVAAPDAVEKHLRVLLRYQADASTGVSFPPSPHTYELPKAFRHIRVAQTFDTGNSLITRRVLAAVGGLDRAFDHGVNTDLDLGTRMYLAGALIVHNPLASRVHYKAPAGGLRTYGSWWAHSTAGLLRPFPAPTQVYYALRHLNRRQRRERVLLLALVAVAPRGKASATSLAGRVRGVASTAGLLSTMPLRVARAWAKGKRLLADGPMIPPSQPDLLAPESPASGPGDLAGATAGGTSQ